MQELSKHVGLTQEQIDRIRRSKASRLTVSLDASPSGEDCEDSGDALSHRLPDPNSTSGSEVMMREERLKVLRALLGDTDSVESLSRSCRPLIESHRSKFSDRELDILRKRFGLGSAGEDRQTLEVIGVQYKVTRERIRQLEGIALKKLRIALEEIDQQHDPDRFEINE
jgi:DNA-directed RNA polymerase sigma subunit (sigma70/sigma32)